MRLSGTTLQRCVMYKVTELLSHGMALIPIPRGCKGPITSGWNEHRNVITSTQLATSLLGLNIGIAHAYCKPKAKQSAPVRLCRHLTTCTSPAYFILLTFNSETNAELIGTRRLS